MATRLYNKIKTLQTSTGSVECTLTPFSFGTVTNNKWTCHRLGNLAIFSGSFTAGVSSASFNYISMPAGLTIDLTKISSDFDSFLGHTARSVDGASISHYGGAQSIVYYDLSQGDPTRVRLSQNPNGGGEGTYLDQTGNALLQSNNDMYVNFTVPIAEWAS